MSKKSNLMLGGALTAVVAGSLLLSKKAGSKRNIEKTTVTESVNEYLNPFWIEPSTPLAIVAFQQSLKPSLMTRSSQMQGVASGLSVLAARGISSIIEKGTDLVAGDRDKSLARRLLVRVGLISAGEALRQLPEKKDESMMVSAARSGGEVLKTASIGGIAYDVGDRIEHQFDSDYRAVPRTILGALMVAYLFYESRKDLEHRRAEIETVDADPLNKALPAIVYGYGFVIFGRTVGALFRQTRSFFYKWYGEGPLKRDAARATNLAVWGAAATGLYLAGVAKIGKANEKLEPAYSQPPTNPLVSGSADSLVDYEELGMQGRRYVHDVITKDQIKEVTGKKAKADPIRTYVGFDFDPLYQSARAELALDELMRVGAYDREYLLLVSPTGTGWIDQTMIEAAEFLTQGDIATVSIQYGKYPSFLSLQKVALGRRQFRLLLWGIRLQLLQLPENKRPKVLVFGESLGAWTSSDTIMDMGIEGFDYYGIDKALWVGLPKLSKWANLDLNDAPKGTMGIFDNWDQFKKLSKPQRNKLKATILNHDNDPIALLHHHLIFQKPDWLDEDSKKNARGVPADMEWTPMNTFVQTAIDAANAMRVTPGQFRSHGHDYRGDMAYFVSGAFDIPATEAQLEKISNKLQDLELEREERVNLSTVEEV